MPASQIDEDRHGTDNSTNPKESTQRRAQRLCGPASDAACKSVAKFTQHWARTVAVSRVEGSIIGRFAAQRMAKRSSANPQKRSDGLCSRARGTFFGVDASGTRSESGTRTEQLSGNLQSDAAVFNLHFCDA